VSETEAETEDRQTQSKGRQGQVSACGRVVAWRRGCHSVCQRLLFGSRNDLQRPTVTGIVHRLSKYLLQTAEAFAVCTES
jgi:hypothetical protein